MKKVDITGWPKAGVEDEQLGGSLLAAAEYSVGPF